MNISLALWRAQPHSTAVPPWIRTRARQAGRHPTESAYFLGQIGGELDPTGLTARTVQKLIGIQFGGVAAVEAGSRKALPTPASSRGRAKA
jgi:hypothetical protein